MALIFISSNIDPSYIALSSDISDNKITGATLIGKKVFTSDDGKWYIIEKDLTLSAYTLPVSATISAGDIQIGAVEIKNSTDDTRAPVTADGLGVVPHGLTKNITVTPTLSVGATYVSGDYVGTTGTPMEFPLAARVDAGTGWVLGAALINTVAESIPMELWLFDTTITPPTDSAAWSISDGDMAHWIGTLTFGVETNWVLSALNAGCRSVATAIPFTCGAASKSLFGCLVTRGVLTGVPTVRLNVAQD